jgi:hypothetical protein
MIAATNSTLGTANQSDGSTNSSYWRCFRGCSGGKVDAKTYSLIAYFLHWIKHQNVYWGGILRIKQNR